MTTTNEITSLPRGTRVTVANHGANVFEVASEVLYDVNAKKSYVLVQSVDLPWEKPYGVFVSAITVVL